MPEDWPREYLVRGQRGIEGWVQFDALTLAIACHRLQREAGERGAIAEIGVHHGRLFIALALLRDAEETAIAVDVFDRQDLNPDGSGHGDRPIFEDNLARWGTAERTHILARDSLTLTPEEIRALAGPQGVRLFSVDGAHTLRHATNDLALAEACLAPGGVMLLDDVFHPHWPEVTEAAVQFLRRPECLVVPLALTGAKLFLVRREDHAAWLARLDARVERYAEVWRAVRFCGSECRALHFAHREALFGQVGRPTRAQRIGAPADLDFQGRGPPAAQLGAGWAPQESWGRWTAGPEARCRVPLPPGLVPTRLVLDVGVPGQVASAMTTLGLEVAGHTMPPLTLSGPATKPHSISLPQLPAGLESLGVVLRPDAGRVAVLAVGVFG